jgi:hypothetical protein
MCSPNHHVLSFFSVLILIGFTTTAQAEVTIHELLRSAMPGSNIGRIAFSPDESHALVVRDDSIFLAPLDGTTQPTRLFFAGSYWRLNLYELCFSADNSRAIYSRYFGGEYTFYIKSLLSDRDDITVEVDLLADAHLSPNRRWLLWSTQNVDRRYELWSLRLTGSSRPVLLQEQYSNPRAKLTNDYAAFKNNGLLYVAPLDGSGAPVAVNTEYGDIDTDSRYLYCIYRKDNPLRDTYVRAVLPSIPDDIIDLDTLGSDDIYPESLQSSPDGRFIAAYTAIRSLIFPTGAPPQPDEAPRQPDPTATVTWSPDSRFATFNRQGLQVIDAHGNGTPFRLNREGVGGLAFTPDSSRLVYKTSGDLVFVVDLLANYNATASDLGHIFQGYDTEGPILDASSTHAMIYSRDDAVSVNVQDLSVRVLPAPAPQDDVSDEAKLIASVQPGEFLGTAFLQETRSVAFRLNVETEEAIPLTPPAATVPGEMKIMGASPVDQSLYVNINNSYSPARGLYACKAGDPAQLALVSPEPIGDEEKAFRFSPTTGVAFFMPSVGANIYKSAAGSIPVVAYNLYNWPYGEARGLYIAPNEAFALVSTTYNRVVAEEFRTYQLSLSSGSDILIEPKRRRFVVGSNTDYRGDCFLLRPNGESFNWPGRQLGISSRFDAAISEAETSESTSCELTACTPVTISRVSLDDAIPGGPVDPDPIHTFNAIAPTLYSESAERLILQPDNYTLQTLSIAPGAPLITVDASNDQARDGLILSPDGQFSAYTTLPNEYDYASVYTVALALDAPARQVPLPNPGFGYAAITDISFSPASNAIVFLAQEYNGGSVLYTAPPDAPAPAVRRSAPALVVQRYIVSSDSAWLAYEAIPVSAPDSAPVWYATPLFGGTIDELVQPDPQVDGLPVCAAGNFYWLAKEETDRVLYAAERNPMPPAFTTQPKSQAPRRVGQSANLAVRLASSAPANLQWEFSNKLPDGTYAPYAPLTNTRGIRGATAHTLRINITSPANQYAGRYRCVATNAAGFAYSRPIFITTTN